MRVKHAALFNGLGGFQFAAHLMNWESVFSSEIDTFCNTVTKFQFPNCIQHEEDIRKTDFTIYRGAIDVVTGGFPCQPFSGAGLRKGKADHRYLWPEMLRAITEVRPAWVVGENVVGIASMVQPEAYQTNLETQTAIQGEDDQKIITEHREYVIETICADLERIGYEVQPLIIPACATGAPHRRDRIWFIAYSNSNDDFRKDRRRIEQEEDSKRSHRKENSSTGEFSRADNIIEQGEANAQYVIADTHRIGSNRRSKNGNGQTGKERKGRNMDSETSGHGQIRTITNSDSTGGIQYRSAVQNSNRNNQSKGSGRKQFKDGIRGSSKSNDATNTSGGKFKAGSKKHQQQRITTIADGGNGKVKGCDISYPECKRLERRVECRKFIRTKRTEVRRDSSRYSQKTDWSDFPTQSPVCTGNDGIPTRLDSATVFKGIPKPRKPISYAKWRRESVKGGGNAVVPPVVYEIFKAIQQHYDTNY